MPNCSVHECTYNLSKEEGKYQSFPLPQDPDLKTKWVHSLKPTSSPQNLLVFALYIFVRRILF